MNRRLFLQTSGLAALLPSALATACDSAAPADGLATAEPAQLASELIFNLRITGKEPYKVSSDARALLQEAVDTGRPLRVLGGGHGYLGSALVQDGLVVDMRGNREISFDATENQVTVQAGARFIDVYQALTSQFGDLKYVLPTGDCPTVGVAGYTLGGGYGHLSRAYGLMCDNVVGIRGYVVDAQGQIASKSLSASSSDQDADLYWALRGAGAARLAVVTDFTFQLRDRPNGIRVYDIRLQSGLNATDIVKAVTLWLAWVAEHIGDPWLSSKMALGSTWFHLSGVHTDIRKVDALRSSLRPYLDPSYPAYDLDFRVESLTQAFKQCASLAACAAQPKQAFAAKSAFLSLAQMTSGLPGLANSLTERRAKYPTYGGVELMLWRMQGGVDTNNAFVHRDHDFLCQFYTDGYTDESDPWMKAVFRAVTGQVQNDANVPGYQNYADGSIAGAETGFPNAYFGGATATGAALVAAKPSPAERLASIRARYRDVFSRGQGT